MIGQNIQACKALTKTNVRFSSCFFSRSQDSRNYRVNLNREEDRRLRELLPDPLNLSLEGENREERGVHHDLENLVGGLRTGDQGDIQVASF